MTILSSFIPEYDENGYKLPISTYTIFDVCPKCGGLNFKSKEEIKCNRCGPGRIEFEEYIAWVYHARNPIKEAEKTTCKVCGKIH